ncbi:TPA: DUF1934 domain-containing protein [Streptococcus pyogenes]|uniref:DUF1934 domain-containing protein n=1 Tax=Streptococcus pyogenes TaxID=1314 RepID=A0A660A3I8_STRPY|nr:DUF1934 domain-containing protein [Streptococcus pyogenes]EPZ45324.1 PF09148 domain protein [Streptococcus pyogenes GA40634]HER4522150.1 DUF1934 domain-containing protein [Streptococcus pyogenes NGAS760]HER4525784.1 DUF1934 domain-containing protein [Streptococcus pyogenes NGAS758]HER4528995.1 DUF1934 domain-containing protein [Streptococcus pyogenes NGAS746]HER4530520.1 DUF1934 domain-containing protein [Streptococcus pyogenes NGAS759]HER4533856.1 DUF1934 domain-containing protein [Strept
MKLQLTNHIRFGDETEIIQEIHDCEWREKGDYQYLIYQNTDKEKVVIKYNETELTMSRFSNPQSIMKFFAGKKVLIALPTPMGVQQFLTDTSHYHLDCSCQKLDLHYHLLQAQTEMLFASYHLELSWD